MPLDLDTAHLRTLVTLAELRSFSRAAMQLNLTQSAVSLRVRKIEELLGKSLVQRGRNGVTLTEDGEILARYGKQILALQDHAIDHVSRKLGPQVISVGVIEEFAKSFLQDLLEQFHRDYPRVRVDVVIDYSRNLRRMLDEDRIHLAILKREFAADSAQPLYSDRLVWVAARGFHLRAGAALPLVVSPAPCVNRAVMVEALDRAGLPWTVTASSPTLSGVVAAVSAGLGLSAMDAQSVPGTLRTLGPADGLPPLPDSDIVLMVRPTHSDRLLDDLVRRLKRFVGRESPPRRRPVSARGAALPLREPA